MITQSVHSIVAHGAFTTTTKATRSDQDAETSGALAITTKPALAPKNMGRARSATTGSKKKAC